jgi:hypothetical protein
MTDFISLVTNLELEVELPNRQLEEFLAKYQEISAVEPNLEYVLGQENKYGTEARVYFNCTQESLNAIQEAGYNIETRNNGYKSQYKYRINSVDLFWSLVSVGGRLGVNK